MKCSEHDELLAKESAGEATEQEIASLRAHEKDCAVCADMRHALLGLADDLDALRDDVPDMPPDFHQGWMRRVEVEANMEKYQNAPRKKGGQSLGRILAWAAAAVFVIGGTALTKDRLLLAAGGKIGVEQAQSADYNADSVSEYNMLSTAEGSMDSAPRAYGVTFSAADNAMDTGSANAATDTTKIIRTIGLTLGTQDFAGDLKVLTDLAAQHDGYISYSSQSGDEAKQTRRATLTMHIPAASLTAFLTGAEGVARVTSRTETAEDVTASYEDTAARLATQQAKMERLQALITSAADLSDLLELESAIADTQYTIDSLQGQLNRTDDQVSYATVEVTLKEETSAVAAQARELTLGERLTSALHSGWSGFVGFLSDMCVFLLAALPYIAIVAVLVVVIVAARRHGKRNREKGE